MKVLIIRLSSIGDIILTTAVLKVFKEKYPEVSIDFLVLDKFKDAITFCPYVDNVIFFNKEKNDGFLNLIKFAKKLSQNGYDYVIDLHSKFRSKIITTVFKYRYSVQTKVYKKRAFWKSLLVNFKLIRYEVDKSIIKNYFTAFEDFELEYEGEQLNFSFENNLEEKFLKYRNYIVFAPGASKETKKWTEENFGNLAKLLYQKYNNKILLIGGKEDKEKCDRINIISENSCENLAGQLSLKESGALLSLARFLLTNDSGPFHIARGVKCRTYVIFGPTSPKMFEFDESTVLIYKDSECSPCSLHGDKKCPKKHFDCMKNLTYNNVYDIINKKEN
ncbi:MAG: glycosyltransferase family 9 protein [Fusobacterium sp.]|nr:glycosyltransferase family 9 protein [Fusobacterium sp.]